MTLPKMHVSAAVKEEMRTFLTEKLPKNAADYAYQLWLEEPFSFVIARTRSSCLGNYTFRNNQHKITINHDLNPYQFLITYIHEIAHQRVFLAHEAGRRKRISPHGTEWKTTFQTLMRPLLTPDVFPPDVLQALRRHMQNPPASTVRDADLLKTLQRYDDKPTETKNQLTLEDIPVGQAFRFNGRDFVKMENRRTRVLCKEKDTDRQFTIPKIATVEKLP